jgi:hypothetical protein
MKRIIVLAIILIISVIFLIKGWVHEIDEYGTREIDLVNAAGKNVCMSCIGLSDENIFEKLFGTSEEKDNE